ncbi:MAG: ParB/RepB/Spo0J family partition protein [Gammaproteobacteria bacterium]|nr:ParB/RepB/Spo0J family partition protein [Gammaproteobacteria bacterium]
MNKKRGLGRGLDALLAQAKPARMTSESNSPGDNVDGSELRELAVDLIQRGRYQPRIDMRTESLEDLAASIKSQGVVQPIVVRSIGSGRFEIIAGERRWRATQMAGLDKIPAIVRDIPDEAAVAMALIENIQREDLNPIEEAMALQRLIDEFSMTHQQAADAVGRSRAAVTNLLRLLSLSDTLKQMLTNGDLEMGHARALLALSASDQLQAAKIVQSKGMSVRETEKLVRKILDRAEKPKVADKKDDPNIRKFQDHLSEILGAKIKFAHQDKGNGKVEIFYNSLEELEGILDHIK